MVLPIEMVNVMHSRGCRCSSILLCQAICSVCDTVCVLRPKMLVLRVFMLKNAQEYAIFGRKNRCLLMQLAQKWDLFFCSPLIRQRPDRQMNGVEVCASASINERQLGLYLG